MVCHKKYSVTICSRFHQHLPFVYWTIGVQIDSKLDWDKYIDTQGYRGRGQGGHDRRISDRPIFWKFSGFVGKSLTLGLH